MPSKVILKVTKGELSGKEFAYSEKEQLFVGRQEDCAIMLPDKSVSRYHCMLEVTPPYVTVRDFGSLNGTFLNGKKSEDANAPYRRKTPRRNIMRNSICMMGIRLASVSTAS